VKTDQAANPSYFIDHHTHTCLQSYFGGRYQFAVSPTWKLFSSPSSLILVRDFEIQLLRG